MYDVAASDQQIRNIAPAGSLLAVLLGGRLHSVCKRDTKDSEPGQLLFWEQIQFSLS